jgi:hypothetical protein
MNTARQTASNERIRTRLHLAVALLVALAQASMAAEEASPAGTRRIDQWSYDLGGIYVFAEIIDLGIKKMALSGAMPAAEMDALVAEATRIAREAGVEAYRESQFMITDLFPPEATEGKDVLLLYKGATLDEYMALKKRKAELIESGRYAGEGRREIARALGRLLSYPDAKIEELIGRNARQARE